MKIKESKKSKPKIILLVVGINVFSIALVLTVLLYITNIKKEILDIIDIQKQDNMQAVIIDENMNNVPIKQSGTSVSSQQNIFQYLKNKN